MNRLQLELHRLYLPDTGSDEPAPTMVDADGKVRALVLEISRPASWEVLGKVWQGVQSELELPAPGIAVSGTDGLQLWFSLDEPILAREAHAFLEALRGHYLSEVPPRRIRLLPSATASSRSVESHARGVPAPVGTTGNWSAFIASDLAPVFVDTPWLDIPPSEEGQAGLLRGLARIKPSALNAAWERIDRPVQQGTGQRSTTVTSPPPTSDSTAADTASDPRRFLLRIMNDETADLALRIDAAKALLPHAQRRLPDDAAA